MRQLTVEAKETKKPIWVCQHLHITSEVEGIWTQHSRIVENIGGTGEFYHETYP